MTKKAKHGIFRESALGTFGGGLVPSSGDNIGSGTVRGTERISARPPSNSASRSQSTGVSPTAVTRSTAAGAAPGTFGGRVTPSSGDRIGSGNVRGADMPSMTASAPARSGGSTQAAPALPGIRVKSQAMANPSAGVVRRFQAGGSMRRANRTNELGPKHGFDLSLVTSERGAAVRGGGRDIRTEGAPGPSPAGATGPAPVKVPKRAHGMTNHGHGFSNCNLKSK